MLKLSCYHATIKHAKCYYANCAHVNILYGNTILVKAYANLAYLHANCNSVCKQPLAVVLTLGMLVL